MGGGRPVFPKRPLWRQAVPFIGYMWMATAEIAGEEQSAPTRLKFWLKRLAALVMMVGLMPLIPLLARRSRATNRFFAHVKTVWKTSPIEAVSIARDVHNRLRVAFADPSVTSGSRSAAIPPYGRFRSGALDDIMLMHYDLEFAAGFYEEALAMAAAWPISSAALLGQVECLLAMQRKEEAIALLESNLHLDDWNSSLRARLKTLAGTFTGGLN
jgi:hypothetical protein